jgi:hypothetical protein
MITLSDRKKIKKYFEKYPKWTTKVLLISIPLIMLYGIGLIGVCIALLFIYKWKQKISDQQFDFYKSESIKHLQQIAIEKMRLDCEKLNGSEYMLRPINKNELVIDRKFNRGKDKVLRYSPIKVNLFFFTEHKLCVYQCIYDLLSGNPLNVNIHQFYYRHIVGTEMKSYALNVPYETSKSFLKRVLKKMPFFQKKKTDETLQINITEQLSLKTKGNSTLTIKIPDNRVLSYGSNKSIDSSRSDLAIAAINEMIDSINTREVNQN